LKAFWTLFILLLIDFWFCNWTVLWFENSLIREKL
jgi:hypothetical protein